MNELNKIKRGVDLELQIESLAYGGMGLARKDDFVYFCKRWHPRTKSKCSYLIKRKKDMQKLVYNMS